jgi:hypothetical protein
MKAEKDDTIMMPNQGLLQISSGRMGSAVKFDSQTTNARK